MSACMFFVICFENHSVYVEIVISGPFQSVIINLLLVTLCFIRNTAA
jgi:hypothetical protein